MNSLVDIQGEIEPNLREQITIDQVIAFFNELIALDTSALTPLFLLRSECNEALADHPTVQVAEHADGYSVGLMGIINGMFGVTRGGFGPIAYVVRDGYLEKLVRREG